MAHRNKIRDAYGVELMCGIKDLPQELVERFEHRPSSTSLKSAIRQASEDVLLVVALCGPHLGSYVRHFGFCLKPVIKCVTVYSSALLVQLVSGASDLFFEAQREPSAAS